jgi:hypothetical protein
MAEPLFQEYDANVEIHPAINLDDEEGIFTPGQNHHAMRSFSPE